MQTDRSNTYKKLKTVTNSLAQIFLHASLTACIDQKTSAHRVYASVKSSI